MHRPFHAVPAVLAVISLLIPAEGQPHRDGKPDAPQGDLTHDDYTRPTQAALPRLHEIHVPALLLTGDADIPDVHAHAGVIEAGIPNSRRVVVTDAGHLMYLEKPDEFTSLVVGFIELNRR